MTIWLDVTTTLGWNRPAVGVVRVETELARHLLGDTDARFCRFDPTGRRYLEVEPDAVRVALARIRTGGADAPDADSSSGPARFEPGDTYLSLGLDWAQKDLRVIRELKTKRGVKTVLCCYDLIPVTLPHLCAGDVSSAFAKYFVDLAWAADRVLCISEHTRSELARFLDEMGGPIPDMDVFRLGTHPAENAPVEHMSEVVRNLASERFILFVSTIERRKNHETIQRAYARLVESGFEDLPRCLFVGMRGWGVDDFFSDLAADRRTRDRIVVLDHVSDRELDFLYERCEFTVFPSLYEGWGLPVAESLARGKLCIASDAASIPEVGGDLVDYLDPWSVPRWAERLRHYFTHPDELRLRERAIRDGYETWSWSSTARQILEKVSSDDRT